MIADDRVICERSDGSNCNVLPNTIVLRILKSAVDMPPIVPLPMTELFAIVEFSTSRMPVFENPPTSTVAVLSAIVESEITPLAYAKSAPAFWLPRWTRSLSER